MLSVYIYNNNKKKQIIPKHILVRVLRRNSMLRQYNYAKKEKKRYIFKFLIVIKMFNSINPINSKI